MQAPDGSPPDVWCRLPGEILAAFLNVTKAPTYGLEYDEDNEHLESAPFLAMAAAAHTQFVQKQHQQELAVVAARCSQQEQELAAVTARCAQQEQELAAVTARCAQQERELVAVTARCAQQEQELAALKAVVQAQ